MAGKGAEIRFGLVLYGGVSLAVYIYGVVVEVQRLLRAAAELERGGDRAETSAYARALAAAGASKVGVDIISGTSAGGINGVLLAKALARGTDVGLARDLWLKAGDIGLLLQPDGAKEPKALLWSEHFERTLGEGMALLDGEASGASMPPPPILDLFVSSTHLRGGPRRFTDSLGQSVDTRQHRYVFQLKLRRKSPGPGGERGYDHDDFLDNERLVRLARATSAFPVAFEPVEIDTGDGLLDPAEEVGGWFADGGILNNKPFSEAVETIFSRAADRPVRRWLLSIDPDPVAVAEEKDAGRQPAFDRIALRSVSAIPRYQSIARDLAALRAHNERVTAAEAVVISLEAEIAAAREGGGDEDGGRLVRPFGPGLFAAYEAMRRQAWALEIADQLVASAREDESGERAGALDRADLHRDLRRRAEEAITADDGGPERDLAYQRRRVYYLIKLLALAVGIEVEGDDDPTLANRLRELLWAEFEALSSALWSELGDPEELAGSLRSLAEVARDSSARLRAALAGVRLFLPGPGWTEDVDERPVEVPLADAFATFPRRDAALLAAEVYDGLRRRDRIDHAQVSPVAATNTTVPAASKLAGDSLDHFGGFLDEKWRENDLMWGRLDGAETLLRIVLAEYGAEARRELLDAVQEEILAEELPRVLDGPEPWKEKLREHAGDGPSPGDLDRRDLAATGLRATSIVRRMLRTAATTAERDTLLARARATTLRLAAKGLGLLLALAYLPAKLIPRRDAD